MYFASATNKSRMFSIVYYILVHYRLFMQNPEQRFGRSDSKLSTDGLARELEEKRYLEKVCL